MSAIPTKRIRTILLAGALVAASLTPVAAANASSTDSRSPALTASHSSAVKPTIVLVHGAWADGSSWSGVATRLIRAGYTVDIAPNPLRGLTYDTEYLQDYLAEVPGPIVLVGHSYGGAVITDAATGNANVKALVYDDAYIPAAGEDVATLSTADSALAPASINPRTVFKLVSYPMSPDPMVVDTYLLPNIFFSDFAPDVPVLKAQLLFASQSPTSTAALGQPSTTPAWTTIPSWDLIGRQDKIIPLAAQLSMAHRAGSHVTEVNSSHVSLISHPAAVAAVILAAVRATS